MVRPTLSVILPNYNHAEFLPTALDAMLVQSHPAIEILVIDDCSTDNSMEILTEYAKKYPIIKVFRNPHNRGVIYNLNMLSNMACGKFLYSAASDDAVMPGLFEKSVAMLSRYPEAAFCSALCLEIDEKGRDHGVVETPGMPREPSFISPGRAIAILENLLQESSLHWFHAPTVVQRREVRLQEGDLDQKLRHACDGFLYHVMALKHGCCFIPEPLAKWRKVATAYSVIGETDIGIRLKVVERTKMLMVCNYQELFPKNYINNWEKRHFFNLQKFALVDFNHSNQRFFANLGKTRYRPGIVGNTLFRLFSLGKRTESAFLAFAVSAPYVRSSLFRSVVWADFIAYLARRSQRLKSRTAKAWQNFLRRFRQENPGITERKGPVPRLSLLMMPVKLALATTVCAGLRLARPLVLVRFGGIDAGDVGELAAFTEMYLCQRELLLKRSIPRFEFLYYEPQVPNSQMREMCKRALRRVHQSVRYLDQANRVFSGYERHLVESPDMSDAHLKLRVTRPHLRFTPAEECMGLAGLRELGVADNAPFVCIHVRPSNHKSASGQLGLVSSFLPTVEELARRGYFVVWMGDDGAAQTLINGNPMFINYSEEKRSDFMDIFLPAKCHFFAASGSEFSSVATAFRRPVVHLNWLPDPIGSFYGSADLFIFPKIRHSEDQGFINFEEMIRALQPAGCNYEGSDNLNGEDCPPHVGDAMLLPANDGQEPKPEVSENSSDEILAVVVEMDERLKGAWNSAEDDEALQRAFQTLLKIRNTAYARFGMRVGASFLRQFHDSIGLSSFYRSLDHCSGVVNFQGSFPPG